MKHRLTIRRAALLALLLLALVLAGCSSQNAGAATQLEPDAAAKSLLDAVAFQDSLVALDDSSLPAYYNLGDAVSEYAIYVSGSRSTAEEIAVLKAADGASVSDVRAIVDKRIEDLKFTFEDYVPKEMVKLEDPVIAEKGDVVILVLADDSAAAKKAVDALS